VKRRLAYIGRLAIVFGTLPFVYLYDRLTGCNPPAALRTGLAWAREPVRVVYVDRRACFEIDPNVRVFGDRTYSDLDGVNVVAGERVLAFEPEAGIEWDATVYGFDSTRDLVYLTVDWATVREMTT
jgi:hypothetical protein